MKDKQESFFSFPAFFRLLDTLSYLKGKQVFYRCYYPVRRFFFRPAVPMAEYSERAWSHSVCNFYSFSSDNGLFNPDNQSFTFLNQQKSFEKEIDWKFREYGLLWTFNLHYFNWLNDDNVDYNSCLNTINQFIDKQDKDKIFIYSYPASIRIVNWIKFLLKNGIKDQRITESLYRQSYRLYSFPEYELMGNHLLQNAIALLWAGIYFGEQRFYASGRKILLLELKEQILEDGAHFEKSPAYHSFLLRHLLELYGFLCHKNNDEFLINKLLDKCSVMLSYLSVLNDGAQVFPHFGDSNEQSMISFNELLNVAQNLRVFTIDIPLSESGLRKLQGRNYHLFFNSGIIPATYQPGHSHADAFSFCLNVEGRPMIVDPGVSTYERSVRRLRERATYSHNTICVAGSNSSDVWASFRMGKRAEIIAKTDTVGFIAFAHMGYADRYQLIHERSVKADDDVIIIIDRLEGWKGQQACLYLHFHPGIRLNRTKAGWQPEGMDVVIELDNEETRLEEYEYCLGFNDRITAQRIVCTINQEITQTRIEIRNGKAN